MKFMLTLKAGALTAANAAKPPTYLPGMLTSASLTPVNWLLTL